jgi:YHS domain-containing protein
MAVETGDGLHAERDGSTYWFCSAYCRDEFMASPQRFVTSHETAADVSGRGR